MRAIYHLAMKDIKLLLRDRFGLFWVIVFPFLMALLFGVVFSGGSGASHSMKVALVTDSLGLAPSNDAETFYAELEKSSALEVQRMPYDSAKAAVGKGKLAAYVDYHPGELDGQPFAMFASEGGPSIEVGIDPSRKAEAGYLQGLVSQAYFARMQGIFSNTKSWDNAIKQQLSAIDTASGIDAPRRRALSRLYTSLDTVMSSVDQLNAEQSQNQKDSTAAAGTSGFGNVNIDFKDIAVNQNGPRTAFEITFPQALQWALIGCAVTFGISIVIERTRGTYTRLRLAPISRAHILAGKGLACFLSAVTVSVLLLFIGIFMFGVRVPSPGYLALAIFASAFCFVGLMMFISVIGKTERSVAGAGWAIFLVFAMTGGGMVPLMIMPPWMLKVGSISPVKWSMLSFEGAIWRGFTLGDMMTPVIILLVYGLVAFLIGVMILQKYDY